MFRLFITTHGRLAEVEHDQGPLHLGRNPTPEPGVASYRVNDPYVSSNQMLIEPTGQQRFRVKNLSRNVPISLDDGRTIPIGGELEIESPAQMRVGRTQIQLDPPDTGASVMMNTIAAPLRKGADASIARSLGELYERGRMAIEAQSPTAETLAHWFETIVSVQRAAAGSGEFYQETARAVVELVGLDCGFVLHRDPAGWKAVARHANEAGREVVFSHSILRAVVAEKRTFYQLTGPTDSTASLQGISAVVAAPIFDEDGQRVVGAVYGTRVQRLGSSDPAIRPLEAQVVQVLAAAVSAGMVRQQREAELARKHVQFEQFFSSELASELDRDASLLEGRDREVTILFSDIRGFSRLSEHLSPRDTCRLISDVMDRLTERIRQHDGVVVDYLGDGLLAMWNAPADQPDHASRAVDAALAMIAELPALDELWRGALGRPLGLGVGINTGPALVGNTGSRLKFKYGPLGHTVNVASRVEGATKHLGVPTLITESTHAQLGDRFATRRVATVRLAGIDHAVKLWELHAEDADEAWLARRDAYEKALDAFEKGNWAETCQSLQPLLAAEEHGHFDLPALTLMSRAINCLRSPPEAFDSVFVLPSK